MTKKGYPKNARDHLFHCLLFPRLLCTLSEELVKAVHNVLFCNFRFLKVRGQPSNSDQENDLISRRYRKGSQGKMCIPLPAQQTPQRQITPKRKGPCLVWQKRCEIRLAESSPYLLMGLPQGKGQSNHKVRPPSNIPEEIFRMLGASGYLKHFVMWLSGMSSWPKTFE